MGLKIKKVIAAALSLLCISIPVPAAAAESEVSNTEEENTSETVIASGESSDMNSYIKWRVTDDGTLYVGPKKDNWRNTVSTGNWCDVSKDPYYRDVYTPIGAPWGVYRPTKLVIEDGITEIGICSFYGLPLEEIELADSVTTISDYAFFGCRGENGTTTVKFSAGLEKILSYAFAESAVEEIVLPRGFYSAGDYAFQKSLVKTADFSNCQSLDLGCGCFANCLELKDIRLSDNTKTIHSRTFSDCTFEEIKLPSNLEVIREEAFWACENLKSLELPETLKKIGHDAFLVCRSLSGEIVFPENVECIDFESFRLTNVDKYIVKNPNTEIRFSFVGNDLSKETIIAGYYNSTAEKVAENNELLIFEPLGVPLKKGDVNGDDEINNTDISIMQKYLVRGEKLVEAQSNSADVNGDGVINVFDTISIKRAVK
ncbi:MAG: leucine-rich repeat protein [Porcipelethomonas sp.]